MGSVILDWICTCRAKWTPGWATGYRRLDLCLPACAKLGWWISLPVAVPTIKPHSNCHTSSQELPRDLPPPAPNGSFSRFHSGMMLWHFLLCVLCVRVTEFKLGKRRRPFNFLNLICVLYLLRTKAMSFMNPFIHPSSNRLSHRVAGASWMNEWITFYILLSSTGL